MTSNTTIKTGNERSEPDVFIWATLCLFEPLVVFMSNGLTVLTFTINRNLLRRSVYCILNLSVADMVVGLCTFISNTVILNIFGIDALVDKSFLYHRTTPVRIQLSVYNFTINATMLSLLVVALERMFATLWPLRHRTLKSSAYVIFIVLPWLLAFIICLGTSFNSRSKKSYLGGPWMCLITLLLCATYIAIYLKFKSRNTSQQFTVQRLSQQERRLLLTVFLVTVSSICSWTPMALVMIIRDIDAFPVPYQIHMGAAAMLVMNSLVNPVIYVFRMKDFREALCSLVCRCIPGRRDDQVEPVAPATRSCRYITESV